MTVDLILHNIRSCHNVGSLMRTADGLGVSSVYITGYTPYPTKKNDIRLPHISNKISNQIHKTALGAESSQRWIQHDSVNVIIEKLKSEGALIVGLEQDTRSVPLQSVIDQEPFLKESHIALLLGSEVDGISEELLELCNFIVEIPMRGDKESFNVSIAGAIALYEILK